MAVLASDVMDQARVFLNETGAVKYTNTVLLPYLKIAGDELNTRLNENSIPTIKKADALQVIAPGTLTYTVPADFYEPIVIHERANGSALLSDFIPMTRVKDIPDEAQTNDLRWWSFLGQTITFLGATSSRQLRLRYNFLIPTFGAASDTVTTLNAKTFLSARVAALAAGFIDEDLSRAKILADYAEDQLNALINIGTKDLQAHPVRRMKFRAYPRR